MTASNPSPADGRPGRVAFRAVAVGLLASALCACSSTPKPPEPTAIRVTLKATDSLNPDMNGRPSPVVVRLFRLRQAVVFSSIDYFTLSDREQEALGGDLLFRESFVLRPGETQVHEYTVENDGRALGVMVGYRDLESSTWRAATDIPAPHDSWLPDFLRWGDRTVDYTATLDERKVTLAPASGN
ncbi:type VI secretion system lipoprotein TssJ [Pseudomonas mangiferae]|nr:type VI secretion system lipoprotein TssJ [Pseudomonas mangiferae]